MLNAISNVILNGFIIHFYTIICILTVCLLYDTLMMVTLVAEICMIKSLNVKCDIKCHTEWLYHTFLYNQLYTNCRLVIRHLMMVTLVAEICMIKSLNVKCDIKYHTEWLYHKFLYNYLYTNCMLVIRHPDDGHTCGRNMFVRIICDRTHV